MNKCCNNNNYNYNKCILNKSCNQICPTEPTGPQGVQGFQGIPGEIGATCPTGPQGFQGILNYTDFYALMPPDNAATTINKLSLI